MVVFHSFTPLFAQEVQEYRSAPNLTPEELTYIQNNPVIRVHVEKEWPPYNFIESNEVKGFSNDYIQLIAEKVGLKVEFVTGYTWNEFMPLLAEGKIDVMTNMVITEERQKFALFSEKPLFKVVQSLLSKRDGEQFETLNQLKGKNLAVVRGYYFEEILKKHYPEINLLLTNSTLDSIKQVEAEKADAALESHAVFHYYTSQYLLTDLVSKPVLDESIFSNVTEQYLGIRKDRPILKSILDKGMRAISEEELTQLSQDWYLIAQQDNFDFTPEELVYLKDKAKINICADPDWFSREAVKNGQEINIGIGGDFLNILQSTIGIPFILIKTKSWTESLQFLQERKCDILSLAISTPERREYANFTQPYLQFPLVLVNRNDERFIPDLTKITNQKVGVVQDFAFAKTLAEKYRKIQFVSIESTRDGLDKVQKKELFGVVDLLPTITYLVQKDYPSLKIAVSFDETWSLSIAVRNDHPLLLSIFEKALASIPEHTRQEIINKRMAVNYESGIDYTLVWRIIFIALILGLILSYRQSLLISYNKKLEHISSTDRLTGCFNRLKIEEFLDQQINLYNRYQQKFSIILYDIDYFKKVNDRYGHLAGDQVLIQSSQLIQSHLRKTDLLGRWGGEEFIIICPHTTVERAQTLAESLRQCLENYHFEGIGHKTASFGVMEYVNSQWSQNDLIKITDDALYQAKENGRNCVRIGQQT